MDNSKLPPYNTDLEGALIGSLYAWNSKRCFEDIVIILPTFHYFYAPNHQVIYRTILELYRDNNAVLDIINICDELKKQGLLTDVGGYSYLHDLMTSAPHEHDVIKYAEKIANYYIAREVLRINSQTNQDIYKAEKSIQDIIYSQEKAISDLETKSEKKGLVHVSKPLESLRNDYIEIKAGNTDKLGDSYISTPYSDLNDMIYGLKVTGVTIIAADSGIGKTALVLNLAHHILKPDINLPVCFFTWEMTRKEITSRLISIDSEVNARDIHFGTVNAEQDKRVLTSMDNIAKSKLYIDDGVIYSTTEIKSKCLKIKREHGRLGAIIIDYIQLYEAIDNKENRTRVIDRFVRDLKIMAGENELDCPVLALSQFSKEIKKRADKRPTTGDLRECLAFDTSMVYYTKEVQSNSSSPRKLLSLNHDYNNRIEVKPSMNIPKNSNDVYRLKTRSGRFIDATANHLVYTSSGYIKLSEFDNNKETYSVGCPIGGDIFGKEYIPESKFIGWMIGNGCMYGYNSPSFITSDEVISNDLIKFIKERFDFRPKWHPHYKSKVYQCDLTHSYIPHEKNRVRKWLKDNDLWGNKSYTKHIPQWFLEKADKKSIIELIQGLWETDGSVIIKKRQALKYSTVSYFLANQILYLLSKLGIFAYIDNGYLSEKATTPIYNITIQNSKFITIFNSLIKLRGEKGEKQKLFVEKLKPSNYTDFIGSETRYRIERLFEIYKIKGVRIQTKNKSLSKEYLKRMFPKIEKQSKTLADTLRYLISDNIVWDKVDSVEYLGVRDVFDRNVKSNHNFIVNGIAVHNSGAIEQHADTIIMVYRDDYYNDDSNKKGIAELIIPKSRGTAIGTIELFFDSKITKFTQLER